MNEHVNYLIKEYEISKDSIKSVMTQLIAVCASLLTVSIVILKLILDDGDTSSAQHSTEPFLLYMVILVVNFIIVFAAYQNIQIQALQMHISSLEKRLPGSDVFRWESKIARVWYGKDWVSLLINSMLVLPPLCIAVLIYVKLHMLVGNSLEFYMPFTLNVLYIAILVLCLDKIINKLKTVIE